MDYNIKEITKHLEKENNVLLYQQDLLKLYNELQTVNKKTYITTPKKGKTAFEQILRTVNPDAQTKNQTISQMIENINRSTEDRTYVFINNFEQLTKRELNNYKELINQKNIQFVVNINEDREFIDDKLLEDFIIINEDEYSQNRSQSININHTIMLIISFFIFMLFLKTQLTATRYITSGLWFTLLMYRTIYYFTK